MSLSNCFLTQYQSRIVIFIALILAACGGESSSSDTSTSDVDIQDLSEPTYPETTLLSLSLDDFDGDEEDITVQLLSDSSNLVESISGSSIVLKQENLLDLDADGQLDSPAEIELSIESEGYLKQRVRLLVSDFGENVQTLELLKLDPETLSQQGVDLQQVDIDLSLASPDQNGYITLTNDSGEEQSAQIKLLSDLSFLTDSGERVAGDNLKVTLLTYTANSAYLPISYRETLGNIEEYNTSLLLDKVSVPGTVAEGDTPMFNLVSMIDLSLLLDDQSVSRFSAGSPIEITMPVPVDIINPTTGLPIDNGDVIPLWSRSSGSSQWNFERMVSVERGELEGLQARFTTDHLTQFNLAFIDVTDTCSGHIYVKDVDGNPFSQQALVTMSSERFFNKDNYLGSSDGRISYFKVPDSPTTLTIQNEDNTLAIQSDLTTVTYTVDEPNHQFSTLTEIDLCRSSGQTITVYNSDIQPTISVTEPSNTFSYVEEGQSSQVMNMVLNLTNPGEQEVEVSYQVSSGWGAEDGVDFIADQDSVFLSQETSSASIAVTLLGDDIAENLYETVKVTLFLDDGITFSDTQQTEKSFYYRIIDDDIILINEMALVSANEQDEQAVINVSLDKAIPEPGMSIYYRAYQEEGQSANPVEDFHFYPYVAPEFAVDFAGQNAQYLDWRHVYIEGGQSEFELTVPIVNDSSVEGSENVTIELQRSRYLSTEEGTNAQLEVAITDDDTQTANVTSLSVATLFSESREDEENWLIVELDQATDEERSVLITTDQSDQVLLGEDQTATLNVTFSPGEARQAFKVTPVNDDNVESDVIVTFTASSAELDNQTAQFTLTDDDYYFVSLGFSQSPQEAFEDSSEEVVWRLWYSGDPQLSDLTVTLQPSINALYSTATQGEDYSVSLPSSIVFSGSEYDSSQVVFSLFADQDVEYSEWVTVDFEVALSQQDNLYYSLPGGYWYGSNATFSKQLVIGNDDILTFSTPPKQAVVITSDSSGQFDQFDLSELIKVSSNSEADFDLMFDVQVKAQSDIASQVLSLNEQQITLSAGQTSAFVPVTLNPLTVSQLELDVDESLTVPVQLQLTLSSETLAQLQEANVEFVLTHSEVTLSLDYKNTSSSGASSVIESDGV